MKKIRLAAIVLAVVCLIAFIAYQSGMLQTGQPTDMPPAAGPDGPEMPVVAIPVRAMVIASASLNDFINVSGTTAATDEVLISSETAGRIKSILFKEGDFVNKGSILVRLDDDELKAQYNRLKVQMELNQKIAERLWGLYEKEGVSLQEYEIAAAELEKSKAELALLEVQLEKRIIRAPFSGRLGLKQVSEGSFLAPGAGIVKLVSLNPIKIEFSVPEKYSPQIKPGNMVEFQTEGVAGILRATVDAVDPSIDAATRTFRIKATAPNPKGQILPGAFANVKLSLNQYDQAIMIPTEAVIPEMGGKKVFIFRNGMARATEVTTGIRQESKVQIVKGLMPGDTVITTGILQLKPDAPVRITEIE